MDMQLWITLVAGLGIGSALTAWIQHWLNIKAGTHQSRHQALEARYKVVILLMYAAFDFDSNKASLRINRPDLMSVNDIMGDLYAEWVNMLLFASAPTLQSLKDFIAHPSREHLIKCALEMRKDLGRDSLNITKFLEGPVVSLPTADK